LPTTNTILWAHRLTFYISVQLQNLLGAYSYAQATPLTPFLANLHSKALRQKNHLPPKGLLGLQKTKRHYAIL